MYILTKKRFQFQRGTEKYTTQGGMAMEEAPNWIVDTTLYKWAKGDGDILEVKGSGDKAANKAMATAEAGKPQSKEPKAGDKKPQAKK